jgi:hypothetical protein
LGGASYLPLSLPGLTLPLPGLSGRPLRFLSAFPFLWSAWSAASSRWRAAAPLPAAEPSELASWEAGGRLLGLASTPRVQARRHHSPAGVGVLDDQGQADAEDSPKQRPHHDQDLAEIAKRSIHEASNVERLSHRCIADAA